MLSGKEIKNKIGKEIIIVPFDERHVKPNGYDLFLNDKLFIYKQDELDMKKQNETSELIIPDRGLVLRPGTLYLGRTLEYTKTEGYIPELHGRSSIGRLGISVHVTAGFGEVGFAGFWTLEITCVQPVRIYPFVKICQIVYHPIEGNYEGYKGKYQHNTDIQSSMLYKDFE